MKQSDFPQLDAMRMGIDYRFPISCRAFSIMVRPLTNLEIIRATGEAADAFMKLPETQKIAMSAALMNAMYQLEKASSADIGEMGGLTLAVLQMMTPDEVNHLWKQYVRITDIVNPSFEKMKPEDLSALAADLKKSSDQSSRLIDLSFSNLIELCQHLLQTSVD